jgi:dTDP-glucose pyrophosphorylase
MADKPDFTATFVGPDVPILRAIEVIDLATLQIALVVDGERRLLGMVTDGDVRRGILRGIGLTEPVRRIMNVTPHSVSLETTKETVIRRMSDLRIHQMPVVDADGRVVGLQRLDEHFNQPREDTWVVLMAGGFGTRLMPLTATMPKPMLPIGGRPLLESILTGLIVQGFRRFIISVHYMADILEKHFGDGSKWGVEITYLREADPRGTAGALSLMNPRPTGPFLVMNSDLMTSLNFRQLLDFHFSQNASATICACEYKMQVPYGVVDANGTKLLGIREKPIESYFVNAGIYVIDSSALDLIPESGRFDMPNLFQAILENGQAAAVFPVREYWLDVGKIDDLARAHSEFEQVFNGRGTIS